jgi:hypothetical protein
MIDLGAPFKTGDAAYARSAPGGYASLAAVPTDPAFGGADRNYSNCPSLGGDMVPGAGAPAPTGSPAAKGADADGGAADIAAVVRIGAPTPPAPVTPPALAVQTINKNNLVFSGVASAARTVTVTYRVNGVATDVVATQAIASGDSAAVAAAKVAAKLMSTTQLVSTSHSNQVSIGTKTPNTLDTLTCAIA